ncbi:hypothetical protein ACQKMD_21985 [Viridibacillus sp. NPDC096237]|uniref:DUF7852 domain-containing protein n=1 Tax=Viridibacillus sp. NPDC096237 TaxID=3390721 RepID=UPI003D0445BF
MSNQVFFEQEVLGFKEISSNVELRNFKFIPDQSGKSLGNGTYTVSKGKITLEGKISGIQLIQITMKMRRNKSKRIIDFTKEWHLT